MTDARPKVIVPARFSESASALRFRAEVNARKLIEAVYAAGGEPLTVHPTRDGLEVDELEPRFGFADGVVLPGGGDLDPSLYGGTRHDSLYDVDLEQDRFDMAVAAWALHSQRPVLAICRGLQVANVHLGGSITAHMDGPHRHVVSELKLDNGAEFAHLVGSDRLTISCYHHQCLDELGRGLRGVARSDDGTIEAVELDSPGWFVGVQWHPEDTAATDPHQAALFTALVAAAATYRAERGAAR